MILIKSPRTKEEFKKYYELRYVILRKNLGQPRGSEKDDYEPISVHFIATDAETCEIIGVIKFFEREPGVAQFSHLAVNEDYQHQGIGRQLVEAVENKAREMGYKSIGSVTRVTSAEFYKKCGYVVKGYSTPLFERVPTFWVEKSLEPVSA
jgi:N-acetylglutamate synthase-like GNAT family acetyltransferase